MNAGKASNLSVKHNLLDARWRSEAFTMEKWCKYGFTFFNALK